MMKALAGRLSASVAFKHARKLLEYNKSDWNYPLTKIQKLFVGVYMLLRDYSSGVFPRTYDEEEQTFASELEYAETLTTMGKTAEEIDRSAMRKPFWGTRVCTRQLGDFSSVLLAFERCGIHPPARLLEVGCGAGWMSELLVIFGYQVVATTINSKAERHIELRRRSMEIKGLEANLQFVQTPMEHAYDAVKDHTPFDATFVYEALHHAHDWKAAIRSFYDCVAEGGWRFILNEPNLVHTLVSYRVGSLSNTHEIGLNPSAVRNEFRKAGFRKVLVLKNRIHGWTRPLWMAAQK